jgi:hypothetical protein
LLLFIFKVSSLKLNLHTNTHTHTHTNTYMYIYLHTHTHITHTHRHTFTHSGMCFTFFSLIKQFPVYNKMPRDEHNATFLRLSRKYHVHEADSTSVSHLWSFTNTYFPLRAERESVTNFCYVITALFLLRCGHKTKKKFRVNKTYWFIMKEVSSKFFISMKN